MGFVLVGLALALLATQWIVKRRIVSELGQFMRRGRVEVGEISISLKRRQARLRDVTMKDAGGNPVVAIPKIDVQIRRIHKRHIDADIHLFDPSIILDFDRKNFLSELFRPEAFREEGFVEIHHVAVDGGKISLFVPGVMAQPETLLLTKSLFRKSDTEALVDVHASGPQTSLRAYGRLEAGDTVRPIGEGSKVELYTTNLILVPQIDTAVKFKGFRLEVSPSDSQIAMSAGIENIPLNAAFVWGPIHGRFQGIRSAAEGFVLDEMKFVLGEDGLACEDNQLWIQAESLFLRSRRWIRLKTGLPLDHVELSASRQMSSFKAEVFGRAVRVDARWGAQDIVSVLTDSIPIHLLLREAGVFPPVSGEVSLGLEATRPETAPRTIYWKAAVRSADLRLGSDFGKISVRLNAEVEGRNQSILNMTGVLEPAPGVLVRLGGKGGPDGFSGRAVMEDRPIGDIRMLGVAFGRDIPLVGESGRAGLHVDVFVNPDLQLSVKGRLKLKNAGARASGFPLVVEGLDVDIPFERTPDAGKLVVAEALAGRITARHLKVGPYSFENFSVKTASKGDKIYADFEPFPAFGGTVRAEALFQFSDQPQEHIKIAVDSVSLKQILAPFPAAREALSGWVQGEANIRVRGGDVMSASGHVRAEATEGPDEPMRVSRRFLEQIGGAAVRKLDMPRQVAYRNGVLKARLSDGRILFDEASLEAYTLLRKVRIGRVVGSYRLKDLIDVLSNVSTDNVKVELGGRKQK